MSELLVDLHAAHIHLHVKVVDIIGIKIKLDHLK